MRIFKILIIALILNCGFGETYGQKYFTRVGKTEFKASVQAFEPVEATNESTTAILNASNGEVAALLFVKAFRFKVALMEEHFNENYMHSDKFPKASFKGKLSEFSLDEIGRDFKDFNLNGTLTIRGIESEIETVARIKKLKGSLIVEAYLVVDPETFEIDIPGIVRDKIAEKVKINLSYELVKKG